MREGINFKTGGIEVICGSMFSGKTEELLRRINRAHYAHLSTALFKPAIETRYHPSKVISHNQTENDAFPVSMASDILPLCKDAQVIGIDEAQFFDQSLPAVCQQLANEGKRVILSGLDMDYTGQPFGCMPELMSIAEYVTKLHAICMDCGNLASFTYRIQGGSEQLELGAEQHYCALCRPCYNQRNKK